MKHIHLIPADFEYFNFDDFLNNSNGVCWSNGGKNGYRAQSFNKGDIVYIYFHDSRGLTNKILLKAIVDRSDKTDDHKENIDEGKFLYSLYCQEIVHNKYQMSLVSEEKKEELIQGAKDNIKGFYLTSIKAISADYENDFVYVPKKKGSNQSGIAGVLINQSKIYLDKQKKDEYIKLLAKLEKTPFKRSLKVLRDQYNNDACCICKKSELEQHTFLKQNNLYYYEIHHVLQQNFNKKITHGNVPSWFEKEKYGENENNRLVYSDYNEVKLCSYHHNQLHYGKLEERKKILDKLVNEKYKSELKKIVNDDCKTQEIINYIYGQYMGEI